MCDVLCVRACTTPVCVFASQSRAPQERLKRPKIESGLYTKFQNRGFLQDPWEHVRHLICEGICAFWVCEKLKNFLARRGSASGRRGHAPRGRRGPFAHL